MTHTCIANTACRAAVIENGARRPAYTEQPDALCDGCTDGHRGDIHRLPRDYAMLRATLGEHRARDGAPVHSTPSPVVLIDSTSDRLMTEIVEWARFAADRVSDALNTDLPDGGRKLPSLRLDGAHRPPQAGSLADRQHELSRPPEHQRLAAYLAIVEPHIELLATLPTEEVTIWAQPRRCAPHAEQVAAASRTLELARDTRIHAEIVDATNSLQAAFAAAGACDECCGWAPRGQARQEMHLSGLDVLLRLTRTHHLIRQHLGQTKLRFRLTMPCPNCGAAITREAGKSFSTCENDQCTPKGPSSWTEREYRFLAGLVTDEERTRTTMKWLLAEAYARLDGITDLIHDLATDKVINQSEAVKLILGALTPRMAGHATPEDRKIASDKDATTLRQQDQDAWAWKREPRYEKPKRKGSKKTESKPADRVTPSSRSTVTDTIIEPAGRNEKYCEPCKLIHAGECA
ncbi:hypothetical protein [Mycolicibacterium llatzerense]|uniref:Uncharacterized protein n=1 Tax=Mycolicibacterium llatzerense TaxID=280871 RepID=A0A0D1LAS6_9MYCO|nr:hypothetical protein [Mycolicibacterium llatzerense]KIU17900.1 hypothetical protein TL10_06495 [Mycolicibacterium llatzerense]